MQGFRSFVMRVLVTLLFLLVPVLGVYTFAIADDYGWWWPEAKSTFGPRIDGLFNMIMWMVAITFVLTNAMLVWCIWWFSRPSTSKATFTHGNHRLEMVWTAIPAVLLLVIAFSQLDAWTDMKERSMMGRNADGSAGEYSVERPLMEVYASQFDWRARYPDTEGSFNGMDVVESAFDICVPVDTPVVFHLKSRDVLHSFFVPDFRLKQDAIPGMTIPVWFQATEVGEYDLICAELCGWGHYKMAGRILVKSDEDYNRWLADKRAALYSNGSEDI